VVSILAVIPLALLIDSVIYNPLARTVNSVFFPLTILSRDYIFIDHSNFALSSMAELVFLVFGIPILVLNLWAWLFPEIIEFYFLGRDKLD
jgi:hypothetical protein